MKRQYSKPSMSVEMFEANEYIASCVKISCNKPNLLGVFYLDNDGEEGYQEHLVPWKKKDEALSVCKGTFEIKENSIKRFDNLYYDSNGLLDRGTVSEAYYFTDDKGENHYFLNNWVPTGTSAS